VVVVLLVAAYAFRPAGYFIFTISLPVGYKGTLEEYLLANPDVARRELPHAEEAAQRKWHFLVDPNAQTPLLGKTLSSAHGNPIQLHDCVPESVGLTDECRDCFIRETTSQYPSKVVHWDADIYVIGCHRLPDPVSDAAISVTFCCPNVEIGRSRCIRACQLALVHSASAVVGYSPAPASNATTSAAHPAASAAYSPGTRGFSTPTSRCPRPSFLLAGVF
jgi:hypothetical protein